MDLGEFVYEVFETVCYKMHHKKDVLKVESSFWLHKMADHVSSQSKKKTTQFRGMFVWIIVFYF